MAIYAWTSERNWAHSQRHALILKMNLFWVELIYFSLLCIGYARICPQNVMFRHFAIDAVYKYRIYIHVPFSIRNIAVRELEA